MNIIALFISTTFFTGFLPGMIWRGWKGKGGGLMGSLVAFALQWYMLYHTKSGFECSLAFIYVSFLLGLFFIGQSERYMLKKWGPRTRHNGVETDHDFNATNLDEVHGQLIAGLPVFLFPLASKSGGILMLSVALIAFRLFDVFKPWPIREIDKNMPGAGGIMFDDTVAGFMAAIATMLVIVILENIPVI